MYAGDQPPPGWLWCDGSAVGRADYPDLFAVFGTTFGPGDGASTFELPDCQGRAPVGAGWGASLTPRNLGDAWGSERHTLTNTELPAHNHQILGNTLAPLYHGAYGGSGARATVAQTTINAYAYALWTTADTGGQQPHNNMQPSLALGFIIWSGAVALQLPGGGGGGYEPVITPTPAPEVVYYATARPSTARS